MVRSKRRAAKLAPLETLFESSRDRAFSLPGRLARLYGKFRMSTPRSGFRVLSNFVSTLDGVVSLQAQGRSGGGDISGFSGQDRMVMGLLRAAAARCCSFVIASAIALPARRESSVENARAGSTW
jgi:hypothetical protein